MATFPRLVGEAKNGKVKVWSIEVVEIPGGGSIVSRHGYEGGVIQMEEKEVMVGKNIGKKNETTALQQAIQDARTTWTKKIASGYKEVVGGGGSNSSTSAVATKSLTESKAAVVDVEIPMPMLAHKLSEKKKQCHASVNPSLTAPEA